MKLLLDTHTAIWALDCPERLGRRGRQLIEDPVNEVLISSIIPWEIAIKMNSRKMQPHVLATDFLRVLQEEEFTLLQIHPLHAIRSGLLPYHHRDPFDRLLAAQSLELNVPLISVDAIFDRYGVDRIW
jgi:PIN domain nuclease of toxin-antitoxin system